MNHILYVRNADLEYLFLRLDQVERQLKLQAAIDGAEATGLDTGVIPRDKSIAWEKVEVQLRRPHLHA